MAAIKPITTYKGKIVPLFNDNIDTDQIIPKVHLKRISKADLVHSLFDEWRYLPDGSDNPDFNPNKPQYKGASILITGDNFGCGSSREHAAWALRTTDSILSSLQEVSVTFLYELYQKCDVTHCFRKKCT